MCKGKTGMTDMHIKTHSLRFQNLKKHYLTLALWCLLNAVAKRFLLQIDH